VTHEETICVPRPGSRRRKLALLLACWLVEGIVWVSIFGGDVPGAASRPVTGGPLVEPAPAANETGAFSARRLDPAAGHRPVFCVSWKNMRAENGQVGVFRTALSRTITIDGLQIKSYRYSRAAEDRQDEDALVQTIAGLGCQLQQEFAGMQIEGPLADVSHAAKVAVRDLHYSLIRDGQPALDIRCRSAIASAPGLQVVLRGGVIIEAAGGDTLMSNCVLWDAKMNQFSIPGAYSLSRHGVRTNGRGMHCDQQLCPLVTQEAYDTKGGGT
jgi:hypothetical protein